MQRHMKTKKEIQKRMMKIFADSNPKNISLSDEETVRVHELQWVLGMRKDVE